LLYGYIFIVTLIKDLKGGTEMASFRIERKIGAPLKKVWDAADFTKSAGPYPMKVLN
jgi:hypothetical protein